MPRAVIEAVARKAAWKPGKRAVADGAAAASALPSTRTSPPMWRSIADVEVDRASGRVSVPRAWAAVDSGQIINPDGLANQMEGGIIQSTSWTLHEEVKFDRTRHHLA